METGGYRIETVTAVQRARADRDLVDGRGFRVVDPGVSRQQAALLFEGRQTTLEDLAHRRRGPFMATCLLRIFSAKKPTIQDMNL